LKNVIFDVGGVLVDWNPAGIVERFYPAAVERAAMHEVIFHHADWLALDRGTLTEPELLDRVRKRAGRPVPELDNLFAVVYESLLPKPDTLSLLAALAERDVPLYCLTNMPPVTYELLKQRYDFWTLFDGVVASGEINLVKPEPAIFEYLLSRYGLAAADTIFIDDMPANIAVAESLGLHGVLFKNAQQCEAELRQVLGVTLGPVAESADQRAGQ
jgi:putative hydrolase of the HAD superfamily